MSDGSTGVLYTEHSGLIAAAPVASLWSYESRARERHRKPVALNADGGQEYWLDRSDPLLNTILPGTGVSVIVNLGDAWVAGRSLAMSAFVPPVCVAGPFTQPRILHVGRTVRAVGAVIPPSFTREVFGVQASEVVDRIVPLQDLWAREDVERLTESVAHPDIRRSVASLRHELVARIGRPPDAELVARMAARLITRRTGRVSIDALARGHHLSRQEFARRFAAVSGMPPKLFARITRFQSLVFALLSSDVAQWASVATAIGFYDQAHMINEFRGFTGSAPTRFFRPHDSGIDPSSIQVRGRPSEWWQGG